jgi:hypothetical protein
MGLDITIRKIRFKHFDTQKTIRENFEKFEAKYVYEFRNIWDWKEQYLITEEEDENGLFYILLNSYDDIVNLKDEYQTKILKEIVRNFEFDKFIYIVQFDY